MTSVRGLPIGPPVVESIRTQTQRDQPFFRPDRHSRGKRGVRKMSRALQVALQLGGLALASVVTLFVAVERLGVAKQFRIASVEVRGNRFLSEGEVRELMGPAMGENILLADLESMRHNLSASPWVRGATLRRKMPSTLLVEVSERIPLAFAETDQLYVMDRGGELVDLLGPRTAGFDLPIVRGLSGVGASVRESRARRAAALIEDLGNLASEVSEISVDRANDLVIVLRGDSSVIKLADPPYRERLTSFLALRPKLKERVPDVEYFDLRFKDRIYVKPASAAVPESVSNPLSPSN